jgi:uncharacterized glyoxalase superfamily protein PhnB
MKFTSKFLTLIALAPLACGAPKADTAQPEPAPAPAPAPVAKAPVKPIPDGFFTLTPQITVKGVDEAVEFYTKAFGAQKLFVMAGLDGKTTMHAEIKIGDSILMIEGEDPEHGNKGPLMLGGSPASLMIYTANADQAVATAVAAGAKVEMPVADMFWGDRYGALVDPFGHKWSVAHQVEDLTPEQIKERAALLFPADPKKAKKVKAAKPGQEPWRKVAGAPAKQPVPGDYHTVTVSIVAPKAAEVIEFYKTAFGAVEKGERMLMPDGRIMHAELKFGDSTLMLSDAFPEHGSKGAAELGGSPVAFHYYTPDVDAAYTKATGSGAKSVMPVTDMFWGDRYGAAVDPAGFQWGFATQTEDVNPADMPARMKKQMEEMQAQQKPTA